MNFHDALERCRRAHALSLDEFEDLLDELLRMYEEALAENAKLQADLDECRHGHEPTPDTQGITTGRQRIPLLFPPGVKRKMGAIIPRPATSVGVRSGGGVVTFDLPGRAPASSATAPVVSVTALGRVGTVNVVIGGSVIVTVTGVSSAVRLGQVDMSLQLMTLPTIALSPSNPTFALSAWTVGTAYPPYVFNALPPGITLDANTGLITADPQHANLVANDITQPNVVFGVQDQAAGELYPQVLLSAFDQLVPDNCGNRFYNPRLGLMWRQTGGDYLDNAGALNTSGFATAIISKQTKQADFPGPPAGWQQNDRHEIMDMTPMFVNWATGVWPNTGALFRISAGSLNLCSKQSTNTALVPRVEITFSDGNPPVNLVAVADSYFLANTDPFGQNVAADIFGLPQGATGKVQIDTARNWVSRWDLSALPSTAIASAKLTVCKWDSNTFAFTSVTLNAYRVSVPYNPVAEPIDYGLSASYPNDNGIHNDPNVIARYIPRFPSQPPTGTNYATSVWARDGIDYGQTESQGEWNLPFRDRTFDNSSPAFTRLRQCRVADITDQVNMKPPPGGDSNSMVLEVCYGLLNTSTGLRTGGGQHDHILLGNDFAKPNPEALIFRETRLSGSEVTSSLHKDAGGNPVRIAGVGSPKHIFARWNELWLSTSFEHFWYGMKGWGAGAANSQNAPYGEINRSITEGAAGDRPYGRDIFDGQQRGGWQGKCERWPMYMAGSPPVVNNPIGQPGHDLLGRTFYFYHMDMTKDDYHNTIDQTPLFWTKNGGHFCKINTWMTPGAEWLINTCHEVIPGTGIYDANFDGIVRGWLNGRLVCEKIGHRMHRDPTVGIDDFWLSGYYGGQPPPYPSGPYSVIYCDLVIAKTYVGPKYVP